MLYTMIINIIKLDYQYKKWGLLNSFPQAQMRGMGSFCLKTIGNVGKAGKTGREFKVMV